MTASRNHILRISTCSLMRRLAFCALIISGWLSLFVQQVQAEVVRFEIHSRVPYATGQSFGETGTYEQLTGRVYFAIDPEAAANRQIVDVQLAPRNEQGRVTFWSDLVILAPADPQRGNGILLYDVNNRGNRSLPGFFNSGDPGDGWLMREGYTILSSGWDGELLPGNNRLRLSPPVARDQDQKLTGLVRCEMVPSSNTRRMVVNWDNHGSYRPTRHGMETATLTVRERAADPRQSLPRDAFRIYVREFPSDSPTQLPLVECEVSAGMRSGWIYELIYEAEEPLVMGTGFAAVRDLISALRTGTGAGNPLPEPNRYRHAIGFGISQSGRFLREFLYSGFNADEQGRQVFDGLIPHVSGSGLGSFNHRFAQPTRHVNQHDHHDYPADRFPFSYAESTDPFTSRTEGLLTRARAQGVMPLILQTQSAGEYWTRSGSLNHTDPLGEMDLALPANVRLYLFGGTQHGPAGYRAGRGVGEHLANHGDFRPYMRGLLRALQGWIVDDQIPPPSVYPTLQAGTLVAPRQTSIGFPSIPGVEFPQVILQPAYQDYGPRWLSVGIMDVQPPKIGGAYRVLVPKVDDSGNELGCLAPPEVLVPLGTHTGWNLRRADVGAARELVALGGSFIPFATTKGERESVGDPRLSLEERYSDQADYLRKLQAVCEKLVSERYLLEEDVPRIIELNRMRTRDLFPASQK